MARTADPLLADRRRRQIMDAAITCFRRRGFHQATMAEICGGADISAGALYRYFSSKAEIISAIAEEMRAESDNAFVLAAEKIGFKKALEMVALETFQKFSTGDGALFADVMAEAMRDDTISQSLRAIDRRSVEVFAQAIIAAQARGEIDGALDPATASNLLFALIEGIGLRAAFLREPDVAGSVRQFLFAADRILSHQS